MAPLLNKALFHTKTGLRTRLSCAAAVGRKGRRAAAHDHNEKAVRLG
jgi:hypothetical protein